MGNSWGHAVRPLTADELASNKRQDEKWPKYPHRCTAAKCQEAPTHATAYNYVTGRAGRVSWSERQVCTVHAERFAAKHGIEIAVAPVPVHASQAMLAAATGGTLGVSAAPSPDREDSR